MTYVMGINHLGVNAIICDTRVTWWRSTTPQRTGENVVLKSGLFFPGCIYAISGSMGHANKFIIECKEYLTGENTLMGFWEKCRQFVECYRFPKGENSAFSLLLSSRYSGEPRFFILDSAQGELRQADRLVTIGSGKDILDSYIRRLFHGIEESLKEDRFHPTIYPYIYCLLLNEMVQGTELSVLEQNDVGGIFHFLWQDSRIESTQSPAVYVLTASEPAGKKIRCWVYRVAYVEDALVVDNPIRQLRQVFTSTSARPSRASIDSPSSPEVMNAIISKVTSQPFYYFCGFAFADPSYRYEYRFHVAPKNDFVVRQDGWVAPEYRAWLQERFTRDHKMELENGTEMH